MLALQKPAAADSRSVRSVATRAKLVAIAERLFAERGIEGVSLNDINKAAGQRNKNCTHYHFGSKDGLLQAILDKHEPGVSARRNALLDEFEARGPLTLRLLVRAMVQALAEKLYDADGGCDFLRFNAQLVLTHTMAALKLHQATFNVSKVDRLTNAIRGVTPDLPEALSHQRGILVAVTMMHGLAEHARLLEHGDRSSALANTELFVANLEDCLVAMLGAEPSLETRGLLRR